MFLSQVQEKMPIMSLMNRPALPLAITALAVKKGFCIFLRWPLAKLEEGNQELCPGQGHLLRGDLEPLDELAASQA